MSFTKVEILRIKAGALMLSAVAAACLSAGSLIGGVWPAGLFFMFAAVLLACMSASRTKKADEELNRG